MRIKMNAYAASPTCILHAGKSYIVPDDMGRELTAAGSGPDGKPAAVKTTGDARKATKPDPQEPEPSEAEDAADASE